MTALRHDDSGASFGDDGADRYRRSRHGPDGAVFLDPILTRWMTSVAGRRCVDIGCGAAPWTIAAAKQGARTVTAVDCSSVMIEAAQMAVATAELSHPDRVTIAVGNARSLEFSDNSFDDALSINVGCCLPPEIFGAHFREMWRVLVPGGCALVSLPHNLGVVFTDGVADPLELRAELRAALASVSSDGKLAKTLCEWHAIRRATIIPRAGRYELAEASGFPEGDRALTAGSPIWRKIPGLVVPNYFYRLADYLAAAKNAGFTVVATETPRYESSAVRQAHNEQHHDGRLGPEYQYAAPFAALELRK